MDRSDIQFRKNCQFYHTKVRKLLRKGNIQQAKDLINEVKKALSQWEDKLRSDKLKVQVLRGVYADLTIKEKQANYKLDRRQEENDSE